MADLVCPQCKTKRTIDDETHAKWAGKPVKCGKCKAPFIVDPPVLSTFKAVEPVVEPPKTRRDGSRKVASIVMWSIVTTIGWLIYIVFHVFLWMFIVNSGASGVAWIVTFLGIIAAASWQGVRALWRIIDLLEERP